MSQPSGNHSQIHQQPIPSTEHWEKIIPDDWTFSPAPYPRERSITELFERQVARSPRALALRWGSDRMTFQQLNEEANQLAHLLRQRGVALETPVGIYMNRSAQTIVTMVAICKAGGSYVPLDLAYPKERLAFMIKDAGAPFVITTRELAASVPASHATVLCLDALHAELARQPTHDLPAIATGESRAYIIYTSGSTGQPKGVEILHRGIGRLVMNTNYIQLDASDRVAQISNTSFDAATFEIWAPLCTGAEIVGMSRDITLSPRAFAAALTEEGLTTVFLTTALFNLVAKEVPDAFRSLRHLMVGGEAHNPHWVRHVLQHGPPERFLNVYGPTECTTFASWHLVEELAADATMIPIGRSISNTSLHILDDSLQPLPVGSAGELYIGGDGLARGYLNRPELTAERFLESPYLKGIRLYKTGDQARWLESGAVEFLGRLDHQIKIRGFRVELGEIRAAILEHVEIADAAVIVQGEPLGERQLVAYLVPRDPGLVERANNILAARVRGLLREKLPAYMVPARYVLLPRLPLTVNGKLDREALPEPTSQSKALTAGGSAPTTATEVRLAALWARLLRIERVYAGDHFFESGGNSLLAAQLQLRIQDEFHVEVPIYTIFEKPILAELAGVVDYKLLSEKARATTTRVVHFAADAELEAGITPCAPYVPSAGEPQHILLTGATGFLGAYLLHRLLQKTTATLYCLVRSASDGEAMAKISKALRKHGLWDPAVRNRIVPVRGDLARVRFGLEPVVWDALASHVEVVYHSGAHINYVQPYSTHRRPNVYGTREVLRFACLGRVKPVHLISTIAIFGPIGFFKGVTDLYEDTDINPSASLLPYDMGYSQSKWVAEKLAFAAQARGLPLSVYRPGFIMGDSATGSTNVEDFLSRIIIGCLEINSYPDLPSQRKEFIPVDYISDAIVHIARNPASLNKIYHLVPPEAEQSVSMVQFFEIISSFGYKLSKLPYSQWQEQLSQHVRDLEGHVLLPLLPILSERIYQGTLTRWELYEQMPRYRSDNTTAALRGSGIVYPDMTRELVATYLDFLRRNNLIAPPSSSQ